MNDKFFLDTNIIVYSFDSSVPSKQGMAQKLIRKALSQQSGCISYQVIQEFLNVATRKFAIPLSFQHCEQYLHDVLQPLCEVYPCIELYSHALQNAERWKYAPYDSLIVTAAIQAGCRQLYSEDLQHGQVIDALTITNPFSYENP
jgi:predicted nucleic acid-binding protein